MASVTLKGNAVSIKGDIPTKGAQAEDFTFVKADLSEGSLKDYQDKIKVLIAVPSLDTGICAIETKKFNEELSQMDGVAGIVISEDLPFAMKRFCETENVENVISASDFRYREFCSKYNTEMTEGPLKGLSARAVWVIDKNNTIQYSELVPEIVQEPNYEGALAAVKSLLS